MKAIEGGILRRRPAWCAIAHGGGDDKVSLAPAMTVIVTVCRANQFRFSEIVSSPEIKNISLCLSGKSVIKSARLTR